MKKMKLLLTLAIPVLLCQNAQAQMSRLIGAATSKNNGAVFAPTDTTAYSYSGTRGGDLTHKMQYDNMTYWTWNDTAYLNSYMKTNTYDSSNNIQSAVVANYDTAIASYVNISKTLYFYAGGLLDHTIMQTYSSGWMNSKEAQYSYVSGRLAQVVSLVFNGAGTIATPTTETQYFYDLSGNLSSAITYTNTSTTSTPNYVQTSKIGYTYSATNQVLTQTNYSYNGPTLSWIASNLQSYAYDSTGDLLTVSYQTYDATGVITYNQTLWIYSNFVNMMPLNELYQVWDTVGGGQYNSITTYTDAYNSYNQLTNRMGESFNVLGFPEFQPGDMNYNYYYETYGSNGVKNVTTTEGELTAFPVPAHNIININLSWNAPQVATITIYDMQGRVLRMWNTTETAKYSTTIAVSEFAAGNYIISVNGKNGKIEKQVSITN